MKKRRWLLSLLVALSFIHCRREDEDLSKERKTCQKATDGEETPAVVQLTKSEKFFNAALNGNMEDLKALIGSGIDIATVNNLGQTVLMLAASTGQIIVIEFILENAPSLKDVKDKNNKSALDYAIQANVDDVIVKQMVKLLQGGVVSPEDLLPDFLKILEQGIVEEHLETLRSYIEKGVDVNATTPEDEGSIPAIFLTMGLKWDKQQSKFSRAGVWKIAFAKLLIEADADLSVTFEMRRDRFMTPLQYAQARRKPEWENLLKN